MGTAHADERHEDRLLDINEVVRNVIGARVRNPHLVEDLAQETLVRVAAVQGSLSVGALQAYAIVTARNLVIGHARSEAIHHRHAHRLVDYTSFDGPEALVLEREETDALAIALEQLDPADRRLLLRHEADGVTTDELAGDAGTSKGAVAMRLARARAVLRVEFIVAFRRVDPPSSRCRPVLVALSAGDRRRQHELNAADHLLRCTTCAELARPVTERRRGIAAWLIVPAAELVRRAAEALRHNRGTQVAAGAAAAASIGVLAVLSLQRSDQPDGTEARDATPAADTLISSPPATPAASAPATAAIRPSATPTGRCPDAAPLQRLDPVDAIGCAVSATPVTVVEVPTDEGFWAESNDQRRVWVQLAGQGESPVDVDPGDQVTVSGVIADPADLGPAAVAPLVEGSGYFLRVRYQDVSTG